MKRYKTPDRKAPRFRIAKYRYNLITQELFNKYKKANPNVEMEWKEFKLINQTVADSVMDICEVEREGVHLPYSMGRVFLGLFPKGKEPIEVAAYRRRVGGYKVFHGFDTYGLQGKIVWNLKTTRYKPDNLNFYIFIPHRNFKTRASKIFIKNPELYTRINKMDRTEERIKKFKQIDNELAGNGFNDQTSYQSGQNTE